MEVLRKVIAILAAVGFLLTAVFALFVVNAANVITDRQAVIGAVTETGGLDGWVRTQAPQFASRFIQEQMEQATLLVGTAQQIIAGSPNHAFHPDNAPAGMRYTYAVSLVMTTIEWLVLGDEGEFDPSQLAGLSHLIGEVVTMLGYHDA